MKADVWRRYDCAGGKGARKKPAPANPRARRRRRPRRERHPPARQRIEQSGPDAGCRQTDEETGSRTVQEPQIERPE